MLIRRGLNGKENYHNLAKHSTWNFEHVNEVFLMGKKINCMHLAREKTHLSSRTFELKIKSMAGEGGDSLNELKYLINAETYTKINAIDIVNQFETGLD